MYEEENPGKILGYAAVQRGENRDVEIEIERSTKTTRLIAILHANRGDLQEFESFAIDPWVIWDGNIVQKSFRVTVPAATED